MLVLACGLAACLLVTLPLWPLAGPACASTGAALLNATASRIGNTSLAFRPVRDPASARAANATMIHITGRLTAAPQAIAEYDIDARTKLAAPAALAFGLACATPLPLRRRTAAAAASLFTVVAIMTATMLLDIAATLGAHTMDVPGLGPVRFIGFGPRATAAIAWLDVPLFRSPAAAVTIAVLTWAAVSALFGLRLLPRPADPPTDAR